MRSRRGFTLTELLVVVAIIILLVAVSVPAFIGATRSGRLSAGVRAVQAALTSARSRAIAENVIYSVEFGEINDPNYNLRIDDDDNCLNDDDHGWDPDQRGFFVAVQCEQPADPADTNTGDVLARKAAALPKHIVLAFGADDLTGDRWQWTAQGPTPSDGNKDGWDDTSPTVDSRDDDCPDIAFQPDGSCADDEGHSTVVLYDVTEEVDDDGNVTVAVITVVKYTGETLVERYKAPRADLQ